jgi:hypothetical protein
VSLVAAPLRRRLPDPGALFIVYALWVEPGDREDEIRIAIANVAGGELGEFAVGGSLARPLFEVGPAELPIVLAMELAQLDGHGEWRFDFRGTDPNLLYAVEVGELQPEAPRPQSMAELNAGAERQLRESLGIPAGEPIPEPAGELPPSEQPEAPYRFDPTQHMDLGAAEQPAPLPPPAPPGPEPDPGAQTSPVPEVPPPATRNPGAFGDQSVPFAH